MLFLLIGFLLFTGSGVYKYVTLAKELDAVRSLSTQVIETNTQMYRTMATGLYHRFKKENGASSGEVSKSFIKNNPYEFEYFVADILEGIYGGEAFVTQSSGDYGVDLEHTRHGRLFLIHALCRSEDADAGAVAVIHSQAVRQEAEGGVVVSVSGFTPEAREYAHDVGVELIDGIQLAHYWSLYLQKKGNQLADTNRNEPGLMPAVT